MARKGVRGGSGAGAPAEDHAALKEPGVSIRVPCPGMDSGRSARRELSAAPFAWTKSDALIPPSRRLFFVAYP